jgi:hypothetical protein
VSQATVNFKKYTHRNVVRHTAVLTSERSRSQVRRRSLVKRAAISRVDGSFADVADLTFGGVETFKEAKAGRRSVDVCKDVKKAKPASYASAEHAVEAVKIKECREKGARLVKRRWKVGKVLERFCVGKYLKESKRRF